MVIEKDRNFSEGFMKDIADMLRYCVENNTDNVDLEFNINGKMLNVNLSFSID